MAKPILRRLAAYLVGAVLLNISCSGGDSPGAPSPSGPTNVPTNVGGAWNGALTFNGTIAQGPITMQLTQAPGSTIVNGTWNGKNNWSGTIDGSVSGATFAGQLVWNYEGNGQAVSRCMATAAISGNAGGTAMTWTSSSVTRAPGGSVFCEMGVTSLRVDATKQ
jgi:hypothetical protein